MKKKSLRKIQSVLSVVFISLSAPSLWSQDLEAGKVDVYTLDLFVVNADLLRKEAYLLNSSSSIIGSKELDLGGMGHFQNLISTIPNLNWVGGTSRPRFFQIRGIGENSQFGNEPPATSVGFIADGIDFTGMGMASSLFDLEQVEVLRGPQAAAFGANAMAGMILIQSADPTPFTTGKAEVELGNDERVRGAFAVGGPLSNEGSEILMYRIAVERHQQNGFRENSFLNRDDVNERNELSTRLKLHWNPVDKLRIKLTGFYLDFDNGYDMWALDNDSFNVSTDEPGRDEQLTRALGWDVSFKLSENFDLLYQGSYSSSDFVYSYDWDWSNPAELMQLYGSEVYYGTDVTERQRKVGSHDLRLLSIHDAKETGLSSWAVGIYAKDFEEEQENTEVFIFRNDIDEQESVTEKGSLYSIESIAVYGQLEYNLNNNLSIEVAFRAEKTDLEYEETGTDFGNDENLWGGKIALNWSPFSYHRFYLSADRGYKIGGINLDNNVPAVARVYDTETLYNYELGWKAKSKNGFFRSSLSLFYMDRRDIQVDSSVQEESGNGNTFTLYKDNAATGENYGAELELDYYVTKEIKVFLSVGYLETKFKEYNYVNPDNPSEVIDLSGSSQAYAPKFNYRIGIDYENSNGLFGSLSLHGVDDIVFNLPSGSELKGYSLVDISVGYRFDSWKLTFWVNNLLDERHDIRGFYFANEPPLYDPPKIWRSQGDPRNYGILLTYEF